MLYCPALLTNEERYKLGWTRDGTAGDVGVTVIIFVIIVAGSRRYTGATAGYMVMIASMANAAMDVVAITGLGCYCYYFCYYCCR